MSDELELPPSLRLTLLRPTPLPAAEGAELPLPASLKLLDRVAAAPAPPKKRTRPRRLAARRCEDAALRLLRVLSCPPDDERPLSLSSRSGSGPRGADNPDNPVEAVAEPDKPIRCSSLTSEGTDCERAIPIESLPAATAASPLCGTSTADGADEVTWLATCGCSCESDGLLSTASSALWERSAK